MNNFFNQKIVVISPHPDDETLGLGGSLLRFAENGAEISILVVSGHLPPLYQEASFLKTQTEAIKAYELMGVTNYEFAKIPATYINQKPVSELNFIISDFIQKIKPNIVFIPFYDRHIDHRVIFDASVVACRPNFKGFPRYVMAYETLSETHWNVPGVEPQFAPEFFIDISSYIDRKIEILNCFESQIINNDSRSAEACKSLARFRGSQNGCKYAESFKIVRIVV